MFASPGLIRGVLWDVLGSAWGCLGLSWVVLTLLGAGWKAFWIDLGLSGAVLARLGAILSRPGADLGPSGSCLEAAKAARTKKLGGRFSQVACGTAVGSALENHLPGLKNSQEAF